MSVRDDIVNAARGQIGAVDDRGGEGGYKHGWEQLKAYMEAAFGDDDIFARGKAWEDGIKNAGAFVTWQTANGPAHLDWCGIFTVWALRQAGIEARWVIGKGPDGRSPGKPARADFANLQPGDILVRHNNVHHCIVAAFDGSSITTLNGNMEYQSILERTNDWGALDKWYYYSIDDYPQPAAAAPEAPAADPGDAPAPVDTSSFDNNNQPTDFSTPE